MIKKSDRDSRRGVTVRPEPLQVDYSEQLLDILESGRIHISSMKPSVWAEKNIVMPQPFPGPLRYSLTPYTREIIDCFAKDHPAREVALMGSAQFGKTASILVPVIGYIIANDPGNIIMTVGHEGLIEEAMNRIDFMLDSTGLRRLIRPSAQRAKSNKTGDTNTVKQFPNGYLKVSAASNPKIWRQADYKFGLIDDYEAVKGKTKVAGNMRDLIEKRFTSYAKSKKIMYVSSPELSQGSNILEVYKMGDQRKFMIPCPCCSAFIELLWVTDGPNGEAAGITWKMGEDNKLIPESVGYICQECGDMFTDQYKSDWVKMGFWKPTAVPVKPEFYSYHMNALYSPVGMDDWLHYVYKYIECNPPGGSRIESKYQSFVNLNLGEPYEATGESIKANQLQQNTRGYDVGVVPESMSLRDGNGKIVLLTCAADLNGALEDARLDYEVVAWSESGSSYSVTHGSIGTFVPREGAKKFKADRFHWTYEHGRSNSVWHELDKVLGAVYRTDTGRGMNILMTGIDTGFCDKQVWDYIDRSNYTIRGVKGDKEDKYIRFGIDVPVFKKGRERAKLYVLQGGLIKDDLAERIRLKWDSGNDEKQPNGFMNFPTPGGGKYMFKNFFEHYEAEHRVQTNVDGEVAQFRWVKVTTIAQNHMFDCAYYNMAMKEIIVAEVAEAVKMKPFVWTDYVDLVLGRIQIPSK